MTKIKLIITVFGDLLNPELFSDIIKLNPTSYWFKGDTIPNRKVILSRKETCWVYSYGFIQTLLFEEISNLFVKNFSNNIENTEKYINENNLETKIDIIVEIVDDEKPSLYFDKKFLEFAIKMKGEVDFDLYHTTNSSLKL